MEVLTRNLILALAALVAVTWLLRWGREFMRAAGVLWYLAAGAGPVLSRLVSRIEVLTDRYPCGEEQLPYKTYRPQGGRATPALVVYHGASPHGEDHPALDNLARAMAHMGLTVFIPRLPQLRKVFIDDSDVEAMGLFYRHVQGHEHVAPGCISVAGVSFGGGLLLKALLDGRMQELPPQAVLAYGTYCDLETALRYALTGTVAGQEETHDDPERWGQVIFFHNYLDQIPGTFEHEIVRQVLDYYVQDRAADGDAARDGLPARERRIVDLILTPGNAESAAFAEEILKKVRPRLASLSPAHFYRQITYPIWVLHGRRDRFVPHTEALALKALLPRQVRLHVSSLYEHRQLGWGRNLVSTVGEALGLIVFMGRFLRAVEG
ncbi:MAG: alpha/beta hydrolase [Candidatus Neomarinimicrobiota bacterium]